MIRNTYEKNPDRVLSAYKDNAAVIEGPIADRLLLDTETHVYRRSQEACHLVAKVETHNHPTAVSPFPGAATGSGGEIRDEGSVGQGSKPKAGLCGFSVSHLRIPMLPQPWEIDGIGRPGTIASALDIMLEAPIGAASYNNEFGRPNLTGYFRTYEQRITSADSARPTLEEVRGYHKPIMIAGGVGNVRAGHITKKTIEDGDLLIVLGGPAMLIGLGGGAASSGVAGSGRAELDYASVQRANPEMQRRCQEVIDACCALGDTNPIISVHDVGAGGLSNALPELVHDSDCGAEFDLRAVPLDDPSLSPLQIWCNESQERYCLGRTTRQC